MIGFCICGSFCNHAKILEILKEFANKKIEILPILSENSANISTRFGKAKDFVEKVEAICSRKALVTIEQTEYLSSSLSVECLIVAPCTGNTLAKMSCGICDTPVTLAAKAHLRNDRPLVIALASNDSLSLNAENFGRMLARRNVFFVPLRQDDADKKPRSMVCDFSCLSKTIEKAKQGVQIQPILI